MILEHDAPKYQANYTKQKQWDVIITGGNAVPVNARCHPTGKNHGSVVEQTQNGGNEVKSIVQKDNAEASSPNKKVKEQNRFEAREKNATASSSGESYPKESKQPVKAVSKICVPLVGYDLFILLLYLRLQRIIQPMS